MDSIYYLLIDLLSISYPLYKSWDPRVNFYLNWKGLFAGIFIMALIFIPWDIAFTASGIWGFNPRYLTGLEIINLPVEEWLFFVAIPYACLFIYEVMNYFVKKDVLGKVAPVLCYVLIPVLLLVGFLHLDKLYTSITCISTGIALAIVVFMIKPPYLGRFFVGYCVSLVPFFIVNGVLTGSLIPEEIVWYNNAENLGIRIGTVPVEDSVYMMLMLLIVTVVMESWRTRAGVSRGAAPLIR